MKPFSPYRPQQRDTPTTNPDARFLAHCLPIEALLTTPLGPNYNRDGMQADYHNSTFILNDPKVV